MNTAPEQLAMPAFNMKAFSTAESKAEAEASSESQDGEGEGDLEFDEEYAQGHEDMGMAPKTKKAKRPDAMDARRRKLHHKAALARESRRKKKQRMNELESENKALQDEVDRLREMLPETESNRTQEKDKSVNSYVQQIVLLSAAVTNGGQPMDTNEALPSLFDSLQAALERQYESAQNQGAVVGRLSESGPLRFVSWLLEQPDSFFTDMALSGTHSSSLHCPSRINRWLVLLSYVLSARLSVQWNSSFVCQLSCPELPILLQVLDQSSSRLLCL